MNHLRSLQTSFAILRRGLRRPVTRRLRRFGTPAGFVGIGKDGRRQLRGGRWASRARPRPAAESPRSRPSGGPIEVHVEGPTPTMQRATVGDDGSRCSPCAACPKAASRSSSPRTGAVTVRIPSGLPGSGGEPADHASACSSSAASCVLRRRGSPRHRARGDRTGGPGAERASSSNGAGAATSRGSSSRATAEVIARPGVTSHPREASRASTVEDVKVVQAGRHVKRHDSRGQHRHPGLRGDQAPESARPRTRSARGRRARRSRSATFPRAKPCQREDVLTRRRDVAPGPPTRGTATRWGRARPDGRLRDPANARAPSGALFTGAPRAGRGAGRACYTP